MSTEQSGRARRYLLGTATEEEAATVEQQYFNDATELERLAAAEDDLVEEYLDERLPPDERRQFERQYLSAPHRRRRVETIRQLRVAAGRNRGADATSIAKPAVGRRWLAAAAALIIAVTGLVWLARSAARPDNPTEKQMRAPTSVAAPLPPTTPEEAPTAPPRPPRIFAVSISATMVRTGSGTPSVVIPSDAEIISVSLEGDAAQRVANGRASIRTVLGKEVWQGPTTVPSALPEGVIAHVRVPASRLPVNDYLITLFETVAGGGEKEVDRYFLRVRAR